MCRRRRRVGRAGICPGVTGAGAGSTRRPESNFAAALSRERALLPFGNRAFPLRIGLRVPLGEETMRWKISPHGHDARQIDLLAIAALLIVVVSALLYFDGSPQPAHTSSFIVPSQSVRW